MKERLTEMLANPVVQTYFQTLDVDVHDTWWVAGWGRGFSLLVASADWPAEKPEPHCSGRHRFVSLDGQW